MVFENAVAAVHAEVFPAALVAHDYHIGTAANEGEAVIGLVEADPGFLCFEVYFFLGGVLGIYGKHAQGILPAVLPLHIEGAAIGLPFGPAQLVVGGAVEIHPGGGPAGGLHKAQFHVGVGIAGLGIAGFFEASMGAICVVQREHFDAALVKAHIGQGTAVGAPPESAEGGGATEDFFPVHPAGVAVQDEVGAIGGEAGFLAGGHFYRVQVIVAGEGHKLFIRTESGILFSGGIKGQLLFTVAAAQENIVVLDIEGLFGPALRRHFIVGGRWGEFACLHLHDIGPGLCIAFLPGVEYQALIIEPLQHLWQGIVEVFGQLVLQELFFAQHLLCHARQHQQEGGQQQ